MSHWRSHTEHIFHVIERALVVHHLLVVISNGLRHSRAIRGRGQCEQARSKNPSHEQSPRRVLRECNIRAGRSQSSTAIAQETNVAYSWDAVAFVTLA